MTEKRLVLSQRLVDAERVERVERVERDREQLAALLPGGSASRPVEVTSAAVIEGHATAAMPCPQCGGQYRVTEHTRPVPSLRRVDVGCRECGVERTLWFRIVANELN